MLGNRDEYVFVGEAQVTESDARLAFLLETLVAGEEVLANFDVDQLEKFLDEHQIEP